MHKNAPTPNEHMEVLISLLGKSKIQLMSMPDDFGFIVQEPRKISAVARSILLLFLSYAILIRDSIEAITLQLAKRIKKCFYSKRYLPFSIWIFHILRQKYWNR